MDWPGTVARMDLGCLDAMGVPTTYTPAAGPAVPVVGIFDRDYERVNVGDAGVSSVGPMVFYRMSDLPTNPADDEPTITVDGVDYDVFEARPDGQGGVECFMHKAAL